MRAAILLFSFLTASSFAAEKPNVIFMMADDMGMGDTSAYQDFTGNADDVQVHTPNMERLARMGVRYTDAHTPSSRCSPTRYGLLTGRYPWRNRLKHWVLFGSQGDPMIERDRPTLATMFRSEGYGTAVVGKWHIGLRYQRADGTPAAGWEDADLTKPLFDGPEDHGFDFVRVTSRSHGTSGPDASGAGKGGRKNGPEQSVGPGHIHGSDLVSATSNGKELISEGENAYVLTKLGGRHSDLAISFLDSHLDGGENAEKPFFLYYPSPSNHSPYTPDKKIGEKPSRGASRTKAGEPMDLRHDFIHENDLILGRFLDWLEKNDDPRNSGKKLIDTTVVVFTSDNGAEKNSDIASGPFRSHKGSAYEGGHRVPFLVAGSGFGIGDGNAETGGRTDPSLLCLTDMFATFAELIGTELPDSLAGEKGAEDSFSVLSAWQGEAIKRRPPVFAHDHKEAKGDPAVAAFRMDDPNVEGEVIVGKWKLFFDASLLRRGEATPIEFYNLAKDPKEETNLISEPDLQPLVQFLTRGALHHRNIGGHRLAAVQWGKREQFDFSAQEDEQPQGSIEKSVVMAELETVTAIVELSGGQPHFNPRGMGISTGKTRQVDEGETLTLTFDQDVAVQHLELVAGNGQCGGFYQVGDNAPNAIYCIDGDIDEKDQSGVLSDIGVVKKGEKLVLSSASHFISETPGRWRLKRISLQPLARD